MSAIASILNIKPVQTNLSTVNRQLNTAVSLLKNLRQAGQKNLDAQYNKFAHYWVELERCNNEQAAIRNRLDAEQLNPPKTGSLPDEVWVRMCFDYDNDRFDYLGYRISILEQLVDVSSKLLMFGEDHVLQMQLTRLELQLGDTLGFDNLILVCASKRTAKDHEAVKQYLKTTVKEEVKTLRATARVLIKKIKLIFLPDRRERFRTIIRFLFKNLDDSSDNEVLIANQQFS